MSFWQELAGLLFGWPREDYTPAAHAPPPPPQNRVFVVGPTGGTWLVVPGESAVVIGPGDGDGDGEVIGPSAVFTIEPEQRGLWEERGWQQETQGKQQIFTGRYRITDQKRRRELAYHGTIYVNRREIVPCIADPPPEIKRHPKGICFTPLRKPWYRLHWHRPAKNVDDAILYMERVLDEAVNGRKS